MWGYYLLFGVIIGWQVLKTVLGYSVGIGMVLMDDPDIIFKPERYEAKQIAKNIKLTIKDILGFVEQLKTELTDEELLQFFPEDQIEKWRGPLPEEGLSAKEARIYSEIAYYGAKKNKRASSFTFLDFTTEEYGSLSFYGEGVFYLLKLFYKVYKNNLNDSLNLLAEYVKTTELYPYFYELGSTRPEDKSFMYDKSDEDVEIK